MAPAPLLRFLRSARRASSFLASHDAAATQTGFSKRDQAPSLGHPLGQGSIPPTSFNNAGFLALFAILGAAMVLASIWFFFWAKNGGFVFREGDWEEYKSTVLRRKGPDGRTLSGATRSTKLGGGSSIAGTQQEYKLARAAARSVVSRDSKGRKGIVGKRGWGKSHSITYSDDWRSMPAQTVTSRTETETIAEEMTENRSEQSYHPHTHRSSRHHHHHHNNKNHHDDRSEDGAGTADRGHHSSRYRDRTDRDVSEYKRERPARVGGLNRPAEGSSHFGPLTATEISDVTTVSHISSAASTTPLTTSDDHRAQRRAARHKERERERAERKAREEAAKMERRWRKEAEEAAKALARESEVSETSSFTSSQPRHQSHRHNHNDDNNNDSNHKQQHHEQQQQQPPAPSRLSRTPHGYSHVPNPAPTVVSDGYERASAVSSSGTRSVSASYYDAYRPHRATPSASYDPPPAAKKPQRAAAAGGGYRRGADSELD